MTHSADQDPHMTDMADMAVDSVITQVLRLVVGSAGVMEEDVTLIRRRET